MFLRRKVQKQYLFMIWAAQKKVTGYPVIFPEEINSDYRICITPKNHEKEIMDQLKNMGISEDRYFTYFDMFECIAKLGK